MISLHIDANSGPELLGQLVSMANMLAASTPSQESGQTLTPTIQNETGGGIVPPAAATEATKPAGRGRGKGRGAAASTNAVPESAKDPERPAFLNRAENDFIVFDGKGEQKAGYTHAKDAAKVMLTLLAALSDVDSIDLFSISNEATLQRFDDAMREPVDQAIIAKYESLGVDTSVDGGDGNNPKDVTKEDVRAAIKLLISEKGNDAALAVMEALKAPTLAEIKTTDYARALEMLNSARKDQPAPAPATPAAKKNLFDG